MGILNDIYNAFGQEPPETDTPPTAGDQVLKEASRAISSASHRGATEPPLRDATISDEDDMTEKTINATLDKVGVLEGGYVNDPVDRGGETNHGVTIGFLKSIKPGATSADLKKLTKDDARKLFDEHFVRRPGFDQLPDVVQAEAVALAINAGVPKAIRVLQKAAGVKQDGHMGPETLAAIKKVDNEEIRHAVDQYYISIVERNPSQSRFLKGWLNRSARINAIPYDASEEADAKTVDVFEDDDGVLHREINGKMVPLVGK